MRSKGFTLVELLAVIVILAIILAIAIPSITNVVSNATRNAFETDAKMVIKAIEYEKLTDDSFNPTLIDADSIDDVLGISNENYQTVSITTDGNGTVTVYIEGKNKWEGLTATGTYKDMVISETGEGPILSFLKGFGGSELDTFTETEVVSDGYVVVGYSESSDGDMDGYYLDWETSIILKYDNNGNVLWQKSYVYGDYTEFYDVVEVSDGYVAIGNSTSVAVLVKYDLNGNFVWEKTLGNSSNNRSFFKIITADNSLIVVGNNYASGSIDAILVKYDLSGNLIWEKTYGGTSGDYFNSLVSVDDGYVIAGRSESTDGDLTGQNNGYRDGVIVKFDKDGNLLWDDNYGGTNGDYFFDITTASDGYIIVGRTESSNGDLEGRAPCSSGPAIILKYDLNGSLLWDNSYCDNGMTGFSNVTKIGANYYAAGSGDGGTGGVSRALLLKYNESGELQGEYRYSSSGDAGFYGMGYRSSKLVLTGNITVADGDFEGLTIRGSSDTIIMSLRNL